MIQREGNVRFPLPLIRYRFACQALAWERFDLDSAAQHDVATIVWNGERDIADPASVAISNRFAALQNAKCRCGHGMKIVARDEDVTRGDASEDARVHERRARDDDRAATVAQTRAIVDMLAALRDGQTQQAAVLQAQATQIELLTRLATPAPAPPAPEPSFWNELTDDARASGWRVAGTQFLLLARDPLVGLLQRRLAPDDPAFRARAAAFLGSEIGTALLALLLSTALLALPDLGGTPKRLARELRVRGMADGSNLLVELFAAPLRVVIAEHLRGDPPAASPAAAIPPSAPPALEAGPARIPKAFASKSKVRVRR